MADRGTRARFEAAYHGECAETGDHIAPGDLVEYGPDGVRHVECKDDEPPRRPACPSCGLEHPGEC